MPAADRRQQHSADCISTWEYAEVKRHTNLQRIAVIDQRNVKHNLHRVLHWNISERKHKTRRFISFSPSIVKKVQPLPALTEY